ncbi:MAG TPA: von Willebrand factor type A domain-containing protein [Polyangiales bacterium]|nr:von Willebrand factor type A domain-containing protein [Polyangiales bacterium]
MRLASLRLWIPLSLLLGLGACGDADSTLANDDLAAGETGDNSSSDDDESSEPPLGSGGAKRDAGKASSSSRAPGAISDVEEEPPLATAVLSDAGVRPPSVVDPTVRAPAVVSPFVDATKDPFSTFGADVDTASYDYLRQSLQTYSRLPSPEYVRVEDYVNYFKYSYPVPAGDAAQPFSISLAAGAHPLGRSSTLLRVGIQAKAAPANEKKPANLVFLVDVSGSMSSPDKLPLVQKVLKEALNVLAPTDKVSIVSYASDTRVRLAPTAVSERGAITTAIDGLVAGGSTNGASGIELAYQQAAAGLLPGGINHVILCTDGDFNLGVTSNEALVSLIESKRATGVTLTALGFGHGNLNDAMMEKVSNAGNGSYSIVFSEDQAIAYANQRLFSTIVHIAKDMKLQVEFNPALVSAYRLVGYEDRAIADGDFRNDTVDGGEVGAEHRVTALYELVLTGQSAPSGAGIPALSSGEPSDVQREIATDELVRVKVRYKAVTATDADPASEVSQSLKPADLMQTPGVDFYWAAAVAAFAELLRVSPYVSAGELTKIEALIAAEGQPSDADRQEFKALVQQAKPLLGAL